MSALGGIDSIRVTIIAVLNMAQLEVFPVDESS